MNKKESNKRIINWLLIGCFLIFTMVIIGGITRLTHSGLSISNYKLISGTIPPLNQTEWEEAFNLYKQYPEYKKLNTHFELSDFKQIYFWEWLHRFMGRLLGVVFLIPFLYFLIKKQLSKQLTKKLIVLLALGALQGFLGWYMVKSGLVDRPDVSHYRLATHLIVAFITFAYAFWLALDLIFPHRKPPVKRIVKILQFGIGLILLQIIYGAFVAGLDAGFIHNNWPLMSEGKFIHHTVYNEQNPLLRNFIEGKSGVQFIHRMLAYFIVAFVIYLWYKTKSIKLSRGQHNSINALLIVVGIQFLLGIFTLIFQVPLTIALAHQVGAFLLLTTITFSLHRFSK